MHVNVNVIVAQKGFYFSILFRLWFVFFPHGIQLFEMKHNKTLTALSDNFKPEVLWCDDIAVATVLLLSSMEISKILKSVKTSVR